MPQRGWDSGFLPREALIGDLSVSHQSDVELLERASGIASGRDGGMVHQQSHRKTSRGWNSSHTLPSISTKWEVQQDTCIFGSNHSVIEECQVCRDSKAVDISIQELGSNEWLVGVRRHVALVMFFTSSMCIGWQNL